MSASILLCIVFFLLYFSSLTSFPRLLLLFFIRNTDWSLVICKADILSVRSIHSEHLVHTDIYVVICFVIALCSDVWFVLSFDHRVPDVLLFSFSQLLMMFQDGQIWIQKTSCVNWIMDLSFVNWQKKLKKSARISLLLFKMLMLIIMSSHVHRHHSKYPKRSWWLHQKRTQAGMLLEDPSHRHLVSHHLQRMVYQPTHHLHHLQSFQTMIILSLNQLIITSQTMVAIIIITRIRLIINEGWVTFRSSHFIIYLHLIWSSLSHHKNMWHSLLLSYFTHLKHMRIKWWWVSRSCCS